jgi:hypothetical protein
MRRLSRRQALVVVSGVVGTLYARPISATQSGRVMSLALDDVAEIQIRSRGRSASVTPDMLIDALSGRSSKDVS